jgi:hypothetical protein
MDAVEFARQVPAFHPDAKQAELLVCPDKQLVFELHAAVGEEHGDGSAGGVAGRGRSRSRWCWW